MSELVRVDHPTASLPEKIEYARHLAVSNLLPKSYRDAPANVILAIEYAEAFGIRPIQAINSIHVIDGKPSASADLIGSMVRKAGHKLRVMGDDTFAEAHLIRADDPDFTYVARWDLAKARGAGVLGKDVWKKYPGAMLKARAITDVCRMGASDALYGVIYTPEELGQDTTGSDFSAPPPASSVSSAAPVSAADRMRAALPATDLQEPGTGGEDTVTTVATPAPATPVEGITPAQVTKLGVAMSGMTRDQALGYVAEVIGRTVTSRNDLTKAEASRVIDRLETGTPSEPEGDVVDAELVPDDPSIGELWSRILIAGAAEGMTTSDVEDDFARENNGVTAASATVEQLTAYLGVLSRDPDGPNVTHTTD